MIKPIIRKQETEKDKRFSAIFNLENATLYSDAVKASLLGYKSMHFQIGDEHMNYYVEGELFNKFASGIAAVFPAYISASIGVGVFVFAALHLPSIIANVLFALKPMEVKYKELPDYSAEDAAMEAANEAAREEAEARAEANA